MELQDLLGVPVLCNFFIWEGLELTHESITVLTLALGKQNPIYLLLKRGQVAGLRLSVLVEGGSSEDWATRAFSRTWESFLPYSCSPTTAEDAG